MVNKKMPDSKKETLRKLEGSRDKWRERSKDYQFEKRKLQDKVRYLKNVVESQSNEISLLKEEEKKN